jgi:hypothetical protein
MVLDGSRVTLVPAVREPAGTKALRVPNAVEAPVASSVKVAPLPLAWKIRSPERADVGMVTLKAPLASDGTPEVATTPPEDVFTVTIAPLAGPAKTVPVMVVVRVEVGIAVGTEVLSVLLLEPPQPASTTRQKYTNQYFVKFIRIFSF